jgi:hypothetical protein
MVGIRRKGEGMVTPMVEGKQAIGLPMEEWTAQQGVVTPRVEWASHSYGGRDIGWSLLWCTALHCMALSQFNIFADFDISQLNISADFDICRFSFLQIL